MMISEKRKHACGYPVTYHIISDAHDPGPVTQFVATMLVGRDKGLPATTDYCPRCLQDLTLENTTRDE
jgi:hypothetical protein